MSYEHVHEDPYPPPGYAPPPPGPQGYPPPGQPEPVGYYGEAPPPPPPGPPSYQGYFNDQYPPPDHIHHDQPADHDSSGCCSFLKGCLATLCCCCLLEQCCSCF
ncbi:cysteine-rich and transmembrane domain-containing protein A-like [Solanum tuberosum]|uniref:DNA binding protein n=2 Tax=Solanum TaxID=4107 RepID=M1CDV0_SOLTU|nr:PREDICTED: cysteine-rich and transmembrane domain-containing protein A-like [Solanum tuberosum]XP_049405605.1 cysteine-rich and transmembrane domain-containing protein WIH2-like [Solanum stenotomum]